MLLDLGGRDMAVECSRKGPLDRCIIQLGGPLKYRPNGRPLTRMIQMNNFIVGQVTPSMQAHLTFGTFIFFGVSLSSPFTAES